MIRDGLFLFHHVVISADSYGTGGLWARWKSRLDPYFYKAANREADLLLCNAFDWTPAGEWCTVKTVNNGICAMDTKVNHAGDTLWDYYRIATRDLYVRYWMSSDYSKIRLLYDDSNTSGYLPFDLLEQLMPSVMLKCSAMTLHGVLMEHHARGIILSAPPGIGKTTHARLWRDHKKALILNGDKTNCCIENGRWIGFSLPWSGSSGEQINRDVPLKAFVVLEQSRTNRIEKLDGLDAFNAFMSHLIFPQWDKELSEKALDLTIDFLDKIPVFRLYCRPDIDAVETLDLALKDI